MTSESDNPELLIGARGWEHAGWRGRFYPEDLPDEWRLSYYANHFRTLLVPLARWRTASDEELSGWPGDTHPEFRFVFECDDRAEALRRLDHFGVQLGALCPPFLTEGDALETSPITLITAAPRSPAELRREVEKAATHGHGAERYLFTGGMPPDTEQLRQAILLAQLLGF